MTAQQFVDTIESYRAQLFAQARRLVRQEADAHVLVQDTISHAFINRTAFRQDINLLNWLRTLMRNLFFTEYRRNQHRRRLLERYPITAGHTYNVGEHSLSIAEADALVKTLSTDFTTPFRMRLEGYTYKEIADQVGVPVGTIKSRIFAVRAKLRKALRS